MKELTVACFIDAFGWEMAKETDFLRGLADHRYKLRSILGYSNAVIPTILTGLMPAEHRHWSFYYYSPRTSPFCDFKWLRFIPRAIGGRHRVRNKLSRWVKRKKGFTGYFQLYNVPFEHIHLFDYCEKRNYFIPGGLTRGETIFDRMSRAGVPYHQMHDPVRDARNAEALLGRIEAGSIRFAYIHLAEVDSALHDAPGGSAKSRALLAEYDAFLREAVTRGKKTYDRVRLLVFSDHGMAPVKEEIDLIARIEATGLRFGRDYAAFYDSTMARFWFLSDGARPRIEAVLSGVPQGRILSDE